MLRRCQARPGEPERLLGRADEGGVVLGAAEREGTLEAGHGFGRVALVEPALAEVLEGEIGVGRQIRGRAALQGVAKERLRPVQGAGIAEGFGKPDPVRQFPRPVGGGPGQGNRGLEVLDGLRRAAEEAAGLAEVGQKRQLRRSISPRTDVTERVDCEGGGALDGGGVDRHLPQAGVVPRRRVEIDQVLERRSAHRGSQRRDHGPGVFPGPRQSGVRGYEPWVSSASYCCSRNSSMFSIT